jgi:hypothetical protein
MVKSDKMLKSKQLVHTNQRMTNKIIAEGLGTNTRVSVKKLVVQQVGVVSKECTTSHCGFGEAISEAKPDYCDGYPLFFPSLAPCGLFRFPTIKTLLKWTPCGSQ